jgi:hypothetical protein
MTYLTINPEFFREKVIGLLSYYNGPLVLYKQDDSRDTLPGSGSDNNKTI